MNIGFIGVGKMGLPMARHVLEAGFNLTVHDLRQEAASPLLEKGAKWVNNPKQVASSCEVVLSCLPGPLDVETAVYGAKGLMEGWKKGDIYVDMSTNSPITIRKVAGDARARGVTVLDAPVSGGTIGAEAATLAIMVGGDEGSFQKVRPILEYMGKNVFHVGDVGCGNIAKLVNNMISGTTNAITAECLVLGVKAGIDVKKLYDALMASSARSYQLERNYPKVLRGDFEPGFRLDLTLKDVGLALALGKECGVPMPVSAAVEQRFIEARAAGYGAKAAQSVILRQEELAGVKVRVSS
ncbi:NAD(P)-dependent oxidoreductase [Chloroflexota bacterium]